MRLTVFLWLILGATTCAQSSDCATFFPSLEYHEGVEDSNLHLVEQKELINTLNRLDPSAYFLAAAFLNENLESGVGGKTLVTCLEHYLFSLSADFKYRHLTCSRTIAYPICLRQDFLLRRGTSKNLFTPLASGRFTVKVSPSSTWQPQRYSFSKITAF